MEAATLQKKKGISKGKFKKTIKNVLCRPDPLFWPIIKPEEVKEIERILTKYKVEIPEFKKPHWNDIKSFPKEERPKPPKIQKVDGLIFGISECKTTKDCSAILLESTINPRAIVQSIIESCIDNKIHLLCLEGLRNITNTNFGIPTSCLGVKENLNDLKNVIMNIAKSYKPPEKINCNIDVNMEQIEIKDVETAPVSITCPYLYRNNKNTRIFNPSIADKKSKKQFAGQDFIEFSTTPKENRNAYMTMIMKKITNNQNRVKRKKTD